MSPSRALLAAALMLLILPASAIAGSSYSSGPAGLDPNDPTWARPFHNVRPFATTSPRGLSPATIKSVYGFSTSSTAGAGETVAVVGAFDNPHAEADLAVFSRAFGLPACPSSNGCFKKVNQTGGSKFPVVDASWALELGMDVQWVHAIAPGAKILLVEANSASLSALMAAEDYAHSHAQYVSNSWGGSEFAAETTYDSHFAGSTVSYFVASGDFGLPANWPSSSPRVISVGGTTLHFSSGKFTSETGWSDGGGGCSAFEKPTSTQLNFSGYGQTNCAGKRATPDVSLVADPATGVSVYDSTSYAGGAGWFIVGGTSAGTPMWAGRAAATGSVVKTSYVYGSRIKFRDVTSGNNGAACKVGFDLCTGRGSWTGATP